MSDSQPTGELHLRVAGRSSDWTLILHGEPPNEDQVASWMQEGMVARVLVAEQGTAEPYTLLVNFAHVVSARLVPAMRGDRDVHF